MFNKMIRTFQNRLGFLVFLLGILLSCGGDPLAPLVRLRIAPIPDGADKLVLSVTINDVTRTQEFTASGSFDLITVGFPSGTTGNATISIVVYSGACLVGSGSGLLKLENDEVRELPIGLTKPSLACGTPAAKLIVQVICTNGAVGSVSAVAPASGIGCDSDREEIYPVGTTVTLHARATVGFFVAWSNPCKSNNEDCTVTLDSMRDQIVQASFDGKACGGWCPDMRVPAGFDSSLYGIVGNSDHDIVAVGEGGKILHFDGKSWTEQVSGVTEALRAVTVVRDSNPTTFVAVGDNGRAIYRTNTTPWKTISGPVNGLRGVVGYYGGSTTPTVNLYAVGDNGTVLTGSLTGLMRIGTAPSFSGKMLNAVSSQSSSSTEVAIVGESGINSRTSLPSTSYDTATTPSPSLLNGVWYGSTRLVAVGGMGTAAVIFSRSYIAGSGGIFNVSVWQPWKSEPPPAGTNMLRAVWGSANYQMYAVGDAGSIINWDGATWTKVTSPTTKNLSAIWGTSISNLYAVGDQGTLLRHIP